MFRDFVVETAMLSSADVVWAAPIGALVGVLAGALIAGRYRISGDRVARRAESQRDALYDLQSHALAARSGLGRYGRIIGPNDVDDETLDASLGAYEIRLERVLSSRVRSAAERWYALAPPFWTNDPVVTYAQENGAWTTFQQTVGAELRSLDS